MMHDEFYREARVTSEPFSPTILAARRWAGSADRAA
jgi:hypothetical protein